MPYCLMEIHNKVSLSFYLLTWLLLFLSFFFFFKENPEVNSFQSRKWFINPEKNEVAICEFKNPNIQKKLILVKKAQVL